jgi:hypothetical protein
MIGRIKDCGLAEAIVVCYNKCKKVVDGFKYNNDLFRDYKELIAMPQGRAGEPARIEVKRQEMIRYARILKEDHYELKGYVEKVLGMLKEHQ